MGASDFDRIFTSFKASLPGRIQVAPETIKRLREELEDFDMPRIAASVGGLVGVWFDQDGDGQIREVKLPVDDAMAFYKEGFQVCIRGVDSPIMAEWRRYFHHKTGLPDRFSCDLFAARKPQLTACHFDPVDGFTLQLAGSKIWRIAPNCSVQLPTADFRDMAIYVTAPLPEVLPEEHEEIVLEAGQLLYMPRGHWHEVMSGSDCPTMSLIIYYNAVTWADLIAPALRSLLLRNEHWRNTAAYYGVDDSKTQVDQWHEMISEGVSELGRLDPQFLFSQEGSVQRGEILRRNPLCTVSIYPSSVEHKLLLLSTVHIGVYSRSYEATVPAEWREPLERLLSMDTLSLEKAAQLAGPESSALVKVLHDLDVVRTASIEP